jgi:hypothetical protein
MRRRLAFYAMFGLFGCAYATLDQLPRSAAELLRGPAEQVSRSTPAHTIDANGKLPARPI